MPPSGSVIACWPPRLLRRVTESVASVTRSPGRISSVLASIDAVAPTTPAGRCTRSTTCSPGHGRHSRIRAPSGEGWCTGGMPLG